MPIPFEQVLHDPNFYVSLDHKKVPNSHRWLNVLLMRVDTKGKHHTIGRITSRKWNTEPFFTMESSAAEHGYGPLLYDLLLEAVFRLRGSGVVPDRESVSPAAQAIWEYYYHHCTDVSHTDIPKVGYEIPFHNVVALDQLYSVGKSPLLTRLKRYNRIVSMTISGLPHTFHPPGRASKHK